MPAWLSALLTRKMLICVFTGFSSGLPLYLLLNLLPAWLRSEGVNLKTIGIFALIQFPYTWKFLWSPFLDRYALPVLGRRRSWSLIMQIGLLLTIGLLGGLSPSTDIVPVLWLTTFLALFSATQDIALDAYRRELLTENELGLGNACLLYTSLRSRLRLRWRPSRGPGAGQSQVLCRQFLNGLAFFSRAFA